MIIYNKSGNEIEYGRAKRIYLFDKFEYPVPAWLSISGSTALTSDDDLECGAGMITTRFFNLANVDAIRFSLNNFRKNTSDYAISLGVASEDEAIISEFKSPQTPYVVSLFYNDNLVDTLNKFTFNGPLVSKPRKIGIHYCPFTGFIALLENNRVIYTRYLAAKLDLSKKYRFFLTWDTGPITISQFEIINWISF